MKETMAYGETVIFLLPRSSHIIITCDQKVTKVIIPGMILQILAREKMVKSYLAGILETVISRQE